MKSFEIVSTSDALLASRRVFAIAARETASSLYKVAPSLEGLAFATALDDIANARLDDCPRLRHWVGTSRSLIHALRRGMDPDPSSVSHLFVDDLSARRIYDLHSFRLIEAWMANAIDSRRPFHVNLDIRPPRNIVLGGRGTLELDDDAAGPVVIESDGERLIGRFGAASLAVDAKGVARLAHGARFQPGHVLRHSKGTVEIPVHDAGLREPYCANAAIVRGHRAVAAWQSSLVVALDLLASVNARMATECLDLIAAVLPLHNSGISFGSASPEEMVGLIYLPAITSIDDIAECILHEAMHQKLYRVEEATRVFEPGSPQGESFYSPWREDARPLRMVLHGAYVFTGVAELWRQVWETAGRQEDHAVRVILRSKQSRRALDVVARHGRLTNVGSTLVSGLRRALDGIEEGIDLPNDSANALKMRLAAHEERHAAYVR